MDFLNKGLEQLSALFKSMTPGSRIIAALLLAVVVVGAGYLFNQGMPGGDDYLLGGQSFSAAELPAMEAAFDEAGLTTYQIDGNRIRVPRALRSAYMGALAKANALPMGFHDILAKELDDLPPWTDRATREARLKNARQRELAMIIRSIAGIESAAVHYDTKKQGGLSRSELTTASVSIRPAGSATLDRATVTAVRNLVAASIAGMKPTDVAVMDLRSGQAFPATSDDHASGQESAYLQTATAFQENVRKELLGALSYVRGVQIAVNVELTKETRKTTAKRLYDPKGTVPVVSEEQNRTTKSESSPQRGRPGIESNIGGPNAGGALGSSGPASTQDDESSNRQERSLVSHTDEETELAPLTPERITVAIAVPTSYYEEIWHVRNPTSEGQPKKTPVDTELQQIEKAETEKIKSHVAQILPKPTSVIDPTPLVSVATFQSVPQGGPLGPSIAEQAVTWFGEYGGSAGMILLGLISLGMLRSIFKGVPAPAIQPTALPPSAAQSETESDEPATAGAAASADAAAKIKRRFASDKTPRDELLTLVQEDPTAAANILKSWIGSGK